MAADDKLVVEKREAAWILSLHGEHDLSTRDTLTAQPTTRHYWCQVGSACHIGRAATVGRVVPSPTSDNRGTGGIAPTQTGIAPHDHQSSQRRSRRKQRSSPTSHPRSPA